MTALAYHELQAAFRLFGKSSAALDERQRRKARAVAKRYARIESLVLSSDEARGVVLEPGAVDKALDALQARYADQTAFHRALDEARLDSARLRMAVQRSLLVEAIIERVGGRVEPVTLTDAEIFYYAHLHRFQCPETRTARQILITINEDLPENRREIATQRMAQIARNLAEHPDRFAELALKHSECPSALNGGLLGEVARGQLFPALDAALFALKSGQLSTVVESELGLHILRCERIQPARTLRWAEVAEALRKRLTEERARKLTQRWLQTLMDNQASSQTAA